jgi:hypothetical protein
MKTFLLEALVLVGFLGVAAARAEGPARLETYLCGCESGPGEFSVTSRCHAILTDGRYEEVSAVTAPALPGACHVLRAAGHLRRDSVERMFRLREASLLVLQRRGGSTTLRRHEPTQLRERQPFRDPS